MHKLAQLAGLTALSGAMLAGAALAEGRVAVMVFDASGSMWNRIDGDITRIEVARDVMSEFFATRDSSVPLSVIAYGHNRRGDCADIEVIAPMGVQESGPLGARLRGINPQGMTPLTDSLAIARDQIPPTAESADIILVTDGLENCEGDPCALAAQLAAEGINIRAHVVGFGLTRTEVDSLSCITEQTGGMLFQTNSGAELAEALNIVTAIEPQPANLTFRAVDARTGQVLAPADWQVESVDSGAVVAAQTSAELSLELQDGNYRISATHPGYLGALDLAAQADMTGIVDVPLDKFLATLILEGVDADSGQRLGGIAWTLINLSDESVQEFSASGERHSLMLPPGDYRVEGALGARSGGANATAVLEQDRIVTVQLAETLPEASVSAPAEIPAGSVFRVDWTGPNANNDYITIVPAGAPEGDYNDYHRTRSGSPAEITAPDALGAHEVRYVLNDGRRVLARQPVTLTPVSAALIAPDEAVAGSRIEVKWTGPDNPNDYITVVEAGAPEGTYNDYHRTRSGSPAAITMPDALGAYEIRYVISQSGRTLASRPITLTSASAALIAPDEAVAGSRIEVQWTGPDNPNDYITVVEAGAPEGTYNDYHRTRSGSPAAITMPDALGAYEIRYVISQSGRTLASRPITLTSASAALIAPDEAVAGSRIEVQWTGPDNPNDYITVVEAGAPEGTYNDYHRTRSGSPASVTMPDALGAYEIRYVISQSGRTLASRPITLTPASATLLDPGPIVPGGRFEVQWTGPDNPNDYITIVEAGAPEGTYNDYHRTRSGSPARLSAPEYPGDFEIRYVISQSGRTLASLPVSVGAGEITLEVEGEVTANGVVTVIWQGPGRYEDFIQIVPAGSTDNVAALREARASQGSPLQLFAPASPGTYELRYRASDSGAVLARIPLVVAQ